MSEPADFPVVVLLEDRPKQRMVFQLNLGIYLDARVVIAQSLKDLKSALLAPGSVQLIVARATFRGAPVIGSVLQFLETCGYAVPLISLGDERERPGLVALGSENDVRPMLQAAARILGITARKMVSKPRPDAYELSPAFLSLLFTFPCDVYDRKHDGRLEKVFSAGAGVPRERVARLIEAGRPLVIESLQRLKLVNAVTEQSMEAVEELADPALPVEKRMGLLAASLDMVSAQFQNAGMDEETVRLADASIKAMAKMAESSASVGGLLKALMSAESGYRYTHCQLLTYLGFHVIKMMGWWGDDQRSILSQAAFYHDISLQSDEEAMVRSELELARAGFTDPAAKERVLAHPQLAARELQAAPEISPEVVRVVIQHHGSPVGRGFSADIGGLENLSKALLLSEGWADYLIKVAEGGRPDNERELRQLKERFQDPVAHQIIETFRYLDPRQFANDFLEAREIDFAASLIAGGGDDDAEAATVVAVPSPAGEESGMTVASTAAALEEEMARFSSGAEGEDISTAGAGGRATIEEDLIVAGGPFPEPERRTIIEGVTDVRLDEKIVVKGGDPEAMVERSIAVKGERAAEGDRERELKRKALAGSTDLMRAALGGSPEKLSGILASCSATELRKTDAEGRTAFHYAAMGGSVPVLRALVEKGVSVNAVDSKRRSALFLAAMYQRNEAFDYLLEQGAKVGQQAMGGMTIAMIGAFSGNMHVLRAAVERGVRLDVRDHNGKMALDLAKQAKHPEAILFIAESLRKSSAPKAAAKGQGKQASSATAKDPAKVTEGRAESGVV